MMGTPHKLSLRKHPLTLIGDLPVIPPTPLEAEGLRLLASSFCAVFHDDGDHSESRCVGKTTREGDKEELQPVAKKPNVADGSSLHKLAGLAGTSLEIENTPVNHMKSEH